ncbi:MAG TPA: nitroreductase family protein [Anaerolineae bacterium]|nr:nitroreductase family protein [Anaerolineae bacterium]
MTAHPELYAAILARCSTRRYDRQPLDRATTDQVREIISSPQPLLGENQFTALLRDAPPGTDLVRELGGYGRIVNPPHYLVPYVLGEQHQLEDAGYRVEQIAVHLAALGIGSCFIGALRRESAVRALYELPDTARIGALLVFGRPAAGLAGRATNRLLRLVAGADRKLPAHEIFFEGSFDAPKVPPAFIAPLIEAASSAPSAVNAQPWRFLWLDGRLHLFVTRRNRRYGYGLQEEYRFHDAGAAMANISLALEALEMRGYWRMAAGEEPGAPSPPSDLEWIATLTLGHAA